MKTKFLFFLVLLTFQFFSCRKDSAETREYIEITIEGEKDSEIITDPEFIIEGNVLKVKQKTEVIAEIRFSDELLETGEKKPVYVKLPVGHCDNKDAARPCDEQITMFLQSYTKVDELFSARLKGKLWVKDELKEVEVVISGTLDEDFQKISGQLWYDVNENNLFDSNENGVNGVSVTIETDEGVYQSDITGRIPNHAYKDGYFELMASTKKLNTITVDLPQVGLVFVEKNVGSDPAKDSDFDSNGQVTGLKVNKGDIVVVNAGLKKK